MSVSRTYAAQVEAALDRGDGRVVLIVALEAAPGREFLGALGRKPDRHHPVPAVLGLGRPAEVLREIGQASPRGKGSNRR